MLRDFADFLKLDNSLDLSILVSEIHCYFLHLS